MKEKTKEILKKNLIGFILGIVSACTISVIAATYFPSNNVTYDNTESGLASTNVQGAIDELYGVCFPPKAGDQIIEDAGLEKDPYECRYFFTGANPNNYITFNNEKAGWRIISVECDGTIKIMRIESIGDKAWDNVNNNWARPASLNTYLNSTYYNGLSSTAQSQIVSKNWSIGAITFNNNLATQINDENEAKWNGKIALITVSEFIRNNSNQSSCGSFNLINDNYSSCVNTGWMDTNSTSLWWTLTPFSGTYYGSSYVVSIDNNGVGQHHLDGGLSSYEVRPALYLSSDVTLTGSGTQSDPYTIE